MLPLFDENPTRRTPFITLTVIIACLAAFIAPRMGDDLRPVSLLGTDSSLELRGDVAFHLERAAIPCEVVRGRPLSVVEIDATFDEGDRSACGRDPGGPALFPDKNVVLAVLSSMFLHAGPAHLGFNALFLWVFGNNVEDKLGHLPFALYYGLGGVVATIAHIVAQPYGTLPIIGASGAIAAIMGTYLVWYPDAPIRTILFLIMVDIRARWFLLAWFVIQFFTAADSDVAWMAHAAGFVFGAIAGLIIRKVQPRLRLVAGQRLQPWDRTGGAGHGPRPHLDEVWEEPHREAYE